MYNIFDSQWVLQFMGNYLDSKQKNVPVYL